MKLSVTPQEFVTLAQEIYQRGCHSVFSNPTAWDEAAWSADL